MAKEFDCKDCPRHEHLEREWVEFRTLQGQQYNQQEKEISDLKESDSTLHRRLDQDFSHKISAKVDHSLFKWICTGACLAFIGVYGWLILHDRQIGMIQGDMQSIQKDISIIAKEIEDTPRLSKEDVKDAVASVISSQKGDGGHETQW